MDILALSVGPDKPPETIPTVLGVFDVVLLFARRAGVLVVQAAGNRGPYPSTVISFSPWVVGVAASSTDRIYPGSLLLGNGITVPGVGLSGTLLNLSPKKPSSLGKYALRVYNLGVLKKKTKTPNQTIKNSLTI